MDTSLKEADLKVIESHLEKLVENLNLKLKKKIISPGVRVGDNFSGFIAKIELETEDEENNSKTLKLISKNATVSSYFKNSSILNKMYRLEILMYENVLNEYQKFEKEKDISEPFQSFPKCYFTSLEDDKEVLIFEDMKEKGFKIYDKKRSLDLAHIKLVLKNYARFHALGFVLKDQRAEIFEKFKEENRKIFTFYADEEFMKSFHNSIEDVMKSLDPVRDKRVRDKFLNYVQNGLDKMYEDSMNIEECTINHGDCWRNNLLFKYEDYLHPNLPTKMCFLDFQIWNVGSPIADLSYFLFTNVNMEILRSYYDFLMKFYHNNLSKFITELGSNPKKLYSWNTFQNHLKMFAKGGIFSVTMLSKIMLADEEDIPNLETIDGIDQLMKNFKLNETKTEKMMKIIRDVVIFCEKHDYF